eukprot:g10931.t1
MLHRGAFSHQLTLVSSDGSQEQLAVTLDDVLFLGITVDEGTGDVYFATSTSTIQRARYDSSMPSPWDVSTVIGGHVEVRVEGYNLGVSIDDVVSFSVRGVECLTLRRESSNSLSCVFGDAAVTSDLGKGIGTGDIAVQTAIGGWTQGGYPGDFIDAKLADHSLKPIITHAEATGRTISARALCFDSTHHYLYYSDLATGSINRISLDDDGSGSVDSGKAKTEFDAFLPNTGAVHGMAIDAEEGENGGYLYFSETHSGTVSRVELSADGAAPPGAAQVLASGLIDPTDVALEPNGARLFFTLRGGSIRAVTRDGSVASDVPQAASLEGGGYEVRRLDSGTRLEGIAIAESEGAGTDPRELRLYWAESGRASRIMRSSLDGTRPQEVLVLNSNGVAETSPIWPRGLIFGAGASAGLLFCEHLGSVRLLPDAAGGLAETVVQADSYPAAVAVHAMVAAADKKGAAGGAFFTQSVD